MRKLYRPVSTVTNFAGLDFVRINWFCSSRIEALVSVAENMQKYDQLDQEGRLVAKLRLAELLSVEESEALKICVVENLGYKFSSYEARLPLWPWCTVGNDDRRLIGTLRSQPISDKSGFIQIGKNYGWTLPVEIMGYYMP